MINNFVLRSFGALAASGLLFASATMASSAGVPPAGEDSGELVYVLIPDIGPHI
jgi:hypothetical protein